MDRQEINAKFRIVEVNSVLESIEQDISLALAKTKGQSKDNYNVILLYMMGKSLVSLREVLVLCSEGLPDGALALSRNIYEQFVILAYLNDKRDSEKFNEIIEKYEDDYTVQRARALKYEAEHLSKSKEKAKEYQDEIDRIKKKYGCKCKGEYWWSDVNGFKEMSDYVAEKNPEMEIFIRLMHLIYKRACLTIHSSYMGNRIRLGNMEDGVIDMGPWANGQESSLFLSVASMVFLTGITYRNLHIKSEEVVQKLNELAIYYKSILNLRSKMCQQEEK